MVNSETADYRQCASEGVRAGMNPYAGYMKSLYVWRFTWVYRSSFSQTGPHDVKHQSLMAVPTRKAEEAMRHFLTYYIRRKDAIPELVEFLGDVDNLTYSVVAQESPDQSAIQIQMWDPDLEGEVNFNREGDE